MKKLILTSACALAMVGSALAQGNVNWNTLSAAAITFVTNSTTYSSFLGGGATGSGAVGAAGGSAALGTGFYYALMIGSVNTANTQTPAPTSLAALATWASTTLLATNSNTAGRVTTVAPNAGATVSQMSPGTTNNIMLVGWSANLGTTLASALNYLNNWSTLGATVLTPAFFGTTTTGFITPLDTSTSPGAAVVGTAATAQGTPVFNLNAPLFLLPVPEPGTMALAALGGASLLLFRRKK